MIPAHNERDLLADCLTSVAAAAAAISIPVRIVVVLDACTDDSATRCPPEAEVLTITARNVGAARAAGFAYAHATSPGGDAHTWYASTDADTVVDPDWLQRQLHSGADMVLGVVRVARWRHFPPAVAQRYERVYAQPVDGVTGHGHVHGANLGCRANLYWQLGGFTTMVTGEDVDLVERFTAGGHHVHWDAQLSVATSDRRIGRAPDGFAAHLTATARHEHPFPPSHGAAQNRPPTHAGVIDDFVVDHRALRS